jgi:hypothetical protein
VAASSSTTMVPGSSVRLMRATVTAAAGAYRGYVV